jgi:hypothetical protein
MRHGSRSGSSRPVTCQARSCSPLRRDQAAIRARSGLAGERRQRCALLPRSASHAPSAEGGK